MKKGYNFLAFLGTLSRNDSLINIGMDDVSRLIDGRDYLSYCVGLSEGENKGTRAGEIAAKLLGQEKKYNGVLCHVTGGDDLTLFDVNNAVQKIYDVCDGSAEIIFGARIDKEYADKMRLDVIGVN
jgi:cell division protein FtsZ